MSLLDKKLSMFGKRTVDWTGMLQRVFREFAEAAEVVDLSEADLDNLFSLPERLIDLAQSGALKAIEIEAGQDGLWIGLPSDPDADDDLDLSMLQLCDLIGNQLTIRLVVNDMQLARALGVEYLPHLSSTNLQVSLRSARSHEANSESRTVYGENAASRRMSS